MPQLSLAPRITLYSLGSPAPAVTDGWLALATLAEQEADAFVFGDGSHPTTRLCAGVVDVVCRQRRPESVLDVGTGTGVLARIARARGATFVVGTDIDSDALASADAHARLDNHPVLIGLSTAPPDHWGARFDLVVANILANRFATSLQRSAALCAPAASCFSAASPARKPQLSACSTNLSACDSSPSPTSKTGHSSASTRNAPPLTAADFGGRRVRAHRARRR